MSSEIPKLDDLPDILTVQEAAQVLRMSRNTAYDRIHEGQVPGMKLGGRLIVPKRALIAMVEGRDWKAEYPAADYSAKYRKRENSDA